MLDIVVILTCSLCGFALGKYFERRVKNTAIFCDDLYKYIASFKVNLDGRQLEMDSFNKEFCRNCSDVFSEYLDGGKLKCRLNSSEQRSVKSFFDGLNAVSSQELIKHIEYYEVVFADINKTASEQARKSSVYVKLGILLGVMVGIVLI